MSNNMIFLSMLKIKYFSLKPLRIDKSSNFDCYFLHLNAITQILLLKVNECCEFFT
jgi:hypothetical protein